MYRVVLISLLAGLTGGCVGPPVRPPAPRPAPVIIAPPPAAAASPTPVAPGAVEPGIWTYAQEPQATAARFGPVGAPFVVAVQCDRTSRMILMQIARPAGSQGFTAVLRATTTQKSVPVEGGVPYGIMRLAATDPILDAMAFSRGRFGVTIDRRERWFPTWPEFTRVLEDCRG